MNTQVERLSCVCVPINAAAGKYQSPLSIDLRLSLKRMHRGWMDRSLLSSFPLPPHLSALLPVWAGCCVAQTGKIGE